MNNNSLDEIVKCDIDLTNPVSSDVSFDSILLVCPAPTAAGAKGIGKATAISKADELLDYGFTVNDAAYIAANVCFSQDPAPGDVYVVIRQKVTDEETQETSYEDIRTTLARANSECGFYGVHITAFHDEADIQATISWIEANEKLFAVEYVNIDDCPIKNFSYNRTFCMFSGQADGYEEDQPAENEYAALAWMAKCFGYVPGSETWALKRLATIVPSKLSSQNKKDLEGLSINTFRRYCGANVSFGGNVLSGEWIDVIRFRDWLKNEIQTNVFSTLQANRKVPFTDAGIGLVTKSVNTALSKGQQNGGIAEKEFDELKNPIPGYTVTAPLASSLTEAERKSRHLSGIKWTARLAGAIHFAEIGGTLTY